MFIRFFLTMYAFNDFQKVEHYQPLAFKCEKCEKIFPTKDSLSKHQELCFNIKKQKTNEFIDDRSKLYKMIDIPPDVDPDAPISSLGLKI